MTRAEYAIQKVKNDQDKFHGMAYNSEWVKRGVNLAKKPILGDDALHGQDDFIAPYTTAQKTEMKSKSNHTAPPQSFQFDLANQFSKLKSGQDSLQNQFSKLNSGQD